MTEIENEWKRLQEHLRLVAESGTCEYVCTPAGILNWNKFVCAPLLRD